MVSDIAVGAEGLEFVSRAGEVVLNVANASLPAAAMFLRSCVAQALSRKDDPRHSLHASA